MTRIAEKYHGDNFYLNKKYLFFFTLLYKNPLFLYNLFLVPEKNGSTFDPTFDL